MLVPGGVLVGNFADHHGLSRVTPAGDRTCIDYDVGQSARAVRHIDHP